MSAVKKINVLQAIRQGKVGGGETHILNLVKNLDKSRFEPVVLSFTDGEMINELKDMGIKSHVINAEKAFDIFKWKQVKLLMQQEKIDLIHIHGTRAGSNIYWAAKNLNLPVVYTIHGWSFHDDQSKLLKKARIYFEQWITKKTNCNISVSLSNQQTGYNNIPRFKSQVINNGIDTDFFDPDNTARKNIRKELKIADDACVICFIGRITQQKDPLTLIHAFKKVSAKNEKAILLMVGEGELLADAKCLAADLGLTEKIVFEKFRSDVADILYSSDIFCLPSLWEGLSIALLEAMAMKKAVIATNVDGSKEMIENKINGVIVPAQQKDLLADSIIQLSSNITFRLSLGEAARKTVLQGFDVKNMTRKIEAVYLNTFNSN